MSSLWYSSRQGDKLEWHPIDLAESVVDLDASLELPMRLVAFADRGTPRDAALLVAEPHAVWVNGLAVWGGMKILSHRDELLVRGRTLFYSDESLPVVRRFELTPGQRPPRCPVCRAAIEDGQSVVECPRCHRVFHEPFKDAPEDAKACWGFRPSCLCGHPTSMDPSALWRPEKELEG